MTANSPVVSDEDHLLAERLATRAGEMLVSLRESLVAKGADPKSMRREGDSRSNRLIVSELRSSRPDDGLLSEETTDDQRRLASRRVWIVDPLDGTREFSEPPRDDWAVHVALCVDGVPAAGAVALPARGVTYSTLRPPTPTTTTRGTVRILVSRTRPPDFVEELARRLSAELVPMGSAGAKAMAVMEGEADVYIHAGGQYEWDSAAPVAVCRAAGLHASRIDGSPLVYNKPEPVLPDILICPKHLADGVLEEIRSLSA